MNAEEALRKDLEGLADGTLKLLKNILDELERGAESLLKLVTQNDEQAKKDRENEELKEKIQRLEKELKEQGLNFNEFIKNFEPIGLHNAQQLLEGYMGRVEELGDHVEELDLDDQEFEELGEWFDEEFEEELDLDDPEFDAVEELDLDGQEFDGFEQELGDGIGFDIGEDGPVLGGDGPEIGDAPELEL